ncbi:MAG: mismatch repair endonuclease MutL [Verrucomicrobiota bacterium]
MDLSAGRCAIAISKFANFTRINWICSLRGAGSFYSWRVQRIRVLPDILASQVAAGEVVERPASVVKELVENSIDAGAGEIRVDIDQGGVALIRVTDDGCGMSREDAMLSLERHATSKLRTAADLAEIRTLGFRGEAVPSIASVSRFRMVTREKDAVAGTELVVEGGKLRDLRDAGCAPGTVIEARSLFFNMPARRKFLRAESTESAHIEHQLRLHALAAPKVRFRLRRDDREVFDLPPAARAIERVRQLVGTQLAEELIPLPRVLGNGLSVEGFVLPAAHARKGRRHQCVFLNGRPVEDVVISRGLTEGFRGAVAEGMHPAAWLWIELEPSMVDVNVHPAKREVRFHRPVEVREAIVESVREGLREAQSAVAPAVASPKFSPPVFQASSTATREVPFMPPAPLDILTREEQTMIDDLLAATRAEESDDVMPDPASSAHVLAAGRFRLLGLLQRRFVLMESDDGLVLFDPKAARERILYEGMLQHREAGAPVQSLLVPVLLDLDPRDMDLILRERVSLASAGIEIEEFGGNTVQVRSLPEGLGVKDSMGFVRELLDELLHGPVQGGKFAFERLARLLARRASLLVSPSLDEARSLLDELFRCELPYCAADGRPTMIEFGMRELERRFGGGR